jgi:predicted SprT family Zn-dependent metalloprotease
MGKVKPCKTKILNEKTGRVKMKKAKIFGRVRHNDNYQSIFLCSCGSKDWITEQNDDSKVYVCKECGERYVLIKRPDWHYVIEECDKSNSARRN